MKNTDVFTEDEKTILMAKRLYAKQWREKNRDKIKEYNKRYWKKVADELSKTNETTNDNGGN